jgi:hypothetical protein
LNDTINQAINEFLKQFGAVLSFGGTFTGVIMGFVGTNAVKVGAVEVVTYTTGAIVGWSLAAVFGVMGLIIIPFYGYSKYDDEAKQCLL